MPDAPTNVFGDGTPGAPAVPPEPTHAPEALAEPLGRLRPATDPEAIADAIRDALLALPAVLTGPGWVDDCGIGTEQRRWAALTGRDGAAETFHAARDHLADALDRARDAAEEIRRDPNPATRLDGWRSVGPTMLRYVAGVSTYARGLLTHTTPRAVRDLLESINGLAGTTAPADLPTAVYTLLWRANAVLVGGYDWEPTLIGPARDWFALVERAGTAHAAGRFGPARDGIGRAAEVFARAVQQRLHVAVDAANAARLAGPLAAECAHAIRLIDSDN